MRTILLYTVGLPGTGKTTLASRLASWLSVAHLRADGIGLELFRFPTFSPEERRMVYAEMGRRAGVELAAGRAVIYDANVNSRAQRDALVHLAQQHGAQAVGIWLQVPIDQAKQRAARVRDRTLGGAIARVVPPHIFDHHAAMFEAPGPDEAIALVSGTAPFELQYRRLGRQLRPLRPKLVRLVQ